MPVDNPNFHVSPMILIGPITSCSAGNNRRKRNIRVYKDFLSMSICSMYNGQCAN